MACNLCAVYLNTFINNLLKFRLTYKEVNLKFKAVFRLASVNKTKVLRNRVVKDNLADCCINKVGILNAVNYLFVSYLNL